MKNQDINICFSLPVNVTVADAVTTKLLAANLPTLYYKTWSLLMVMTEFNQNHHIIWSLVLSSEKETSDLCRLSLKIFSLTCIFICNVFAYADFITQLFETMFP